MGSSLNVDVAEGKIVGVDCETDNVASFDGIIVNGKIAGVGIIDALQPLTIITRTTIRVDLFIVAVTNNTLTGSWTNASLT